MQAHFIKALANLQNMLSEAAARGEQAVHAAVNAFTSVSPQSALTVIANDHAIDSAEILIEEECLKILALYQPVASDLRQVITILKVNNEIERVGDLAVNIAERVADIASFPPNTVEKPDFRVMAAAATGMLKRAFDSLAYHDGLMAEEVIAADEEVDKIHHGNYSTVREAMLQHPAQAQYYMNGLTVSRCLERIADIATNIAEDVIYLESGCIVRHHHEGEEHGK